MSIQFWIALTGPVVSCLQTQVDNWNDSHKECQVEIKNLAGPLNYAQPAKVALDSEPSYQPSIVLAPEYMTAEMAQAIKSKKVVPLYEIFDESQLSNVAKLVQRTFGDQQGRAISLPFNPACGILYTNKTALEKAGVDKNFTPATMEELEEVCKKLIDLKIVDNGYTCAWPAAYLIEVPAAQQDIALVTPDNGFSGYGQYQMSQKWFRNHLLEIRQQIKDGIFVYSGKDNNAKKPFLEKKVAFYLQGSSHAQSLELEATAAGFTLGHGALPMLEKGQQEKYAFPLGGSSIWVMDNKQTQSAIKGVREFLAYLASNKVQKALHEQAASVPVSASLPATLEVFYKDHPLHKAVVAQTIDAKLGNFSYGIRMPNYAEARKALFDLIEKIVDVQKTSDAEVDRLLVEFDKTYSTDAPK